VGAEAFEELCVSVELEALFAGFGDVDPAEH
jgi:hypothetical protein